MLEDDLLRGGRGFARAYPVGAEVTPDGASFRVWAPDHERVSVAIEGDGGDVACAREPDGHFSAFVPSARAGDLYRFRLGDGALLPDPASRSQPHGPHGPSRLVDPTSFVWTDRSWRGVAPESQLLYELHVGTFTREGTFRAAVFDLPRLAKLGITTLELMPVGEFAGEFGWGYDGVALFAPHHAYGEPDDLRAMVDAAHALGLAVILDVVYNHLGPDGNYLPRFSRAYLSSPHAAHTTEWGDAINYDGAESPGVREFFVTNAAYWIREFHFDGLRFDATHAIFDESGTHVLAEMTRAARAAAAPRRVYLASESERQRPELVRQYGMDAMWNDDVHHTAIAALTGRRDAYYTDHAGTPQELVSAAKWGFLFQGQRYEWQKGRRGAPSLDLPPSAFVAFLENHDQVANGPGGARLPDRTTAGRLRALTAYLLLGPATPLLFQGQELGVRTPFVFFADHRGELAEAVRRGRREFLAQFEELAAPEAQARIDDPADPATFARCKLDRASADGAIVALFEDLIALRRSDAVFARGSHELAGAVLAPEAFLLRFFARRPRGGEHDGHREGARWTGEGDRLLLVNLGGALERASFAEPLLAPPAEREWHTLWSSEERRYGGPGVRPVETDSGWSIPGHAAVVLA
jgi:maltooligosyltrehalose trehalohydrolase